MAFSKISEGNSQGGKLTEFYNLRLPIKCSGVNLLLCCDGKQRWVNILFYAICYDSEQTQRWQDFLFLLVTLHHLTQLSLHLGRLYCCHKSSNSNGCIKDTEWTASFSLWPLIPIRQLSASLFQQPFDDLNCTVCAPQPGYLSLLHYLGAAVSFTCICFYTVILTELTRKCVLTGYEKLLYPLRIISTVVQITVTICCILLF